MYISLIWKYASNLYTNILIHVSQIWRQRIVTVNSVVHTKENMSEVNKMLELS